MPNYIIFLNPSFKQVMHYKIKAKTELTEILLLQAVIFLLITSKVKLKTAKNFITEALKKHLNI